MSHIGHDMKNMHYWWRAHISCSSSWWTVSSRWWDWSIRCENTCRCLFWGKRWVLKNSQRNWSCLNCQKMEIYQNTWALDWVSSILGDPISSVRFILSSSYIPIYGVNCSSSSTRIRCISGGFVCLCMCVSVLLFSKVQSVNPVLERSWSEIVQDIRDGFIKELAERWPQELCNFLRN